MAAEPKIQEIPNSDEEEEEQLEEEQSSEASSKVSRNEKKSRQAFSKCGLKPYPGIVRVTVLQSRNLLFAVPRPDVYTAGDNKFVVFGEIKIEDLNASAQKEAMERLAQSSNFSNPETASLLKQAGVDVSSLASGAAAAGAAAEGAGASSAPAPAAEAAAPAASAASAATGAVKREDVELVMKQARVSEEKAIAALTESGGDIVDAIMTLGKMNV